MIPEIITLRYGEGRSRRFQSANVGLEITVRLEDGENSKTARLALKKWLKKVVREDVEEAIVEVIQAEEEHLQRSIATLERENAARRTANRG